MTESTNKELDYCPFCGGKVIEVNPSWNLANAECTRCGEEWGHCGAKFEGRYDKWNTRTNTQVSFSEASASEVEQLRKELISAQASIGDLIVSGSGLVDLLKRTALPYDRALNAFNKAMMTTNKKALQRHDNEVRAEERERCAVISGCFENDLRDNENWEWFDDTIEQLSLAIRNLKEKP